MLRRSSLAAIGVILATSVDAGARPTRPRFEPTDLELEDPGTTELDTQLGVSHGTGPSGNRLILPDFELDLGLFPNAELDIDGAFSLDRFDQHTRAWGGEALWVASKLGLFDVHGPTHPVSFAAGLQIGPRFPTIAAKGIGYGVLGLFGIARERTHVVVNLGGIIDPGPEVARGQAKSIVAGLDLDLDLDARGTWSLLGEAAMAHYVSPDPDELTATLGAAFDPTSFLELSTIGLVGFLPGQDRIAVLFGISPKIPLW